MSGRTVCERCGSEVGGSWRSAGINAVEHDFAVTPDGTGLSLFPSAVLACSWNCLAVLAARRAGSTADGAVRMVAERERQVTAEGWSPEHDQQHAPGELAAAGVCYAVPHAKGFVEGHAPEPDEWPWDREWWKPRGLVPDLVRAGALLAAELDADRRRNPEPDPVRF